MDYFRQTAPCGIDCFNCEIHENNISNETSSALSAMFNIEQEKIACKGCRDNDGCSLNLFSCKTLDCVKEKQVDFCNECNEFPCDVFIPAKDGAEKFPHNFKLYNLCRIGKVGLEEWAKNESVDIRKRYFTGKFIPGTGPVINS